MIIHLDTQERLISETTVGAGSTNRQGAVLSDSLVATLWVDSVISGTLSVSVYTLTDVGKELLLFSFPVVNTGTASLLLKKAGVSMTRFRVVADYSGVCSYEVYIRAVMGVGESSSKIVGAASLSTDQVSVGGSPTVLIASALVDRQGLILKNWSTGGNLFLSESTAKLPDRSWPLGPKDCLAMDVAGGVTIYGISDAGVLDIRVAQAGV